MKHQNDEWESFDFKEWEEKMKQEGFEVKIPESLKPENIVKKLEGETQYSEEPFEKTKRTIHWKPIAKVASFFVVCGLTLTVISIGMSKNFDVSHSTEYTPLDSMGQQMEDAQVNEAEDVPEDSFMMDDEKKDSVTNDIAQEYVNGDEEVSNIAPTPRQQIMGNEGSISFVQDLGYLYSIAEREEDNGKKVGLIKISTQGNSKQYEIVLENDFLAQAICIKNNTLGIVAKRNQQQETVVMFYDVTEKEKPTKVSSISVEGNLVSTHFDGRYFNVFMNSGKFSTFDMSTSSIRSVTRETSVTDGLYYMNGNNLYEFTVEDKSKTKIKKYILDDTNLQPKESVVIEESRQDILAVKEIEDGLEFIVGNQSKQNEAITLYTLDERMNLINQSQNVQKNQVLLGASFIKDNVVCFFSDKTGDNHVSMFQAERTKRFKELDVFRVEGSGSFDSFVKSKEAGELKAYVITKQLTQETAAYVVNIKEDRMVSLQETSMEHVYWD